MSGDDRDRRSWRRLAWRVRAGVLAVLAGAGAGAWLWAPPYLREALHDSRLILAGAVALSCLLLLALLGRAMLLAAAHARKAHRTGQEGQAILEFALVMPILLMIVLVMIQVSLLMGGLVNLHYSAYCAARAGVVAVPLQTNSEAQNQMGDFQADAWVPNSDEKIQRVFTAAVFRRGGSGGRPGQDRPRLRRRRALVGGQLPRAKTRLRPQPHPGERRGAPAGRKPALPLRRGHPRGGGP
ncbi:MAG: pilus assembly protein [Planctomycetota bacterium]|nr:pilus assembly protein [Planctomycetota bacterium]